MASFTSRTSLAVVVVIAVSISAAASRSPATDPTTFQEWLSRLRALVNHNIDCFLSKGIHDVKMAESLEKAWSGRASSSKSWRSYSSSNLRGLQLPSKQGGVIVSTFNAHVNGGGYFNARLIFNNVAPFRDNWGAFHITSTGGHWLPFNYAQMFSVPCRKQSKKSSAVRLQTRSSSWEVNSAQHAAVLLPPPAFLSSVRASSISAKSAQVPVGNLKHTIKVNSKKALLIMAANGRIKGNSGQTSLTYTVDGYAPTSQHKQDYGFYHVTKSASKASFLPMGLYQFAEVQGGYHKIQLEGKGSNFDLNYATSQVTVIPVDHVQLKTATAGWTMTAQPGGRRQLLETRVVATEASLLAMTATFEIKSKCSSNWAYIFFTVNGKALHPNTVAKKVSLSSFHVNWKSTFSYPGSMLLFDKVPKGSHRVALVVLRGGCDLTVTRAVLQVGIIPQTYQ